MSNPGHGVGRAPCGGWPASPPTGVGSCYQHRKSSDDGLPYYENVTKMTDVALGAPGGIAIATRSNDGSIEALPPCASTPSGCGSTQLCGPWRIGSEDPADVESADQVDFNAYSIVPGEYVNHSKCRMIGFKNVQAERFHSGRLAFTSPDSQAATDIVWDSTHDQYSGGVCLCYDELPAADQTKYLVRELSVQFDQTPFNNYGGGCTGGTAVALAFTLTTDEHSGVKTISGCTDSDTGDTSCTFGVIQSREYPSSAFSPWSLASFEDFILIGNWTLDYIVQRFSVFIQGAALLPGFTTTRVGNVWTLVEDSSGKVYEQVENDFAANFRRIVYEYDGATQRTMFDEVVTLTGTTLNYTSQLNSMDPATPDDRLESVITVECTLSGAHTATDVKDDVVALLAEWDLGDNARYPWRQDEFVGVAPLVTRNETYTDGGFTADMDCSWVDPFATQCDGAIKGSPNPAGYDGHFDFNHRTHACCLSFGTPVYYIVSYGAKSAQSGYTGDETDGHTDGVTHYGPPKCATQWTENGNYSDSTAAGYRPHGAFAIWTANKLIAQKWAEIKLPWKSYNYARPCGQDRFLIDETLTRCVVTLNSGDGSGGTPWDITIDSAVAIVSTDVVMFCGGTDNPSITAVCTATRVGGAGSVNYTLVKICDAPARTDCGTGIFGKIRFNSAPGICGRNIITAATNANPVQITVTDTTALRTGDSVTIAGVFTPANGAQTITVISDTVFTLDGVDGTASAVYAGGGYATSTGATSYVWNDDQSKGDFLSLEYTGNFRDYQERDRVRAETCTPCVSTDPVLRANQLANGMPKWVSDFTATQHGYGNADCNNFSVCDPQVMCISPNTETFNHDITLGFNWPTGDSLYGNRWQRFFIQQWPDHLWQAPHQDCDFDGVENGPTDCDMTEDDGTCAVDTCAGGGGGDRYYPRRPMREASNEVSGTPALPTGIYKHLLTYSEMQSATPVDGFVIPPPTGGGYDPTQTGVIIPQIEEMAWGLYIREYMCVCAGGLWADQYAEEGADVTCP